MNRKLGPNWGYPQFRVIFAQKLGWSWVGGCKFSKIVVKVGVGVAKLKKIVVDVEFVCGWLGGWMVWCGVV